jgi:hypothetical protein
MRLWILSDLHLELTQGWDLPPPADRPDFDVMIVAGDLIPRAERGVKWLAQRVTNRPVLYVASNHEFYGADETRTIEKAKVVAAGTSVRVLQNEVVRICNVAFVGATLWTDFELLGDRPRAMRVAGERMMTSVESALAIISIVSDRSTRSRATWNRGRSSKLNSARPARAPWWRSLTMPRSPERRAFIW